MPTRLSRRLLSLAWDPQTKPGSVFQAMEGKKLGMPADFLCTRVSLTVFPTGHHKTSYAERGLFQPMPALFPGAVAIILTGTRGCKGWGVAALWGLRISSSSISHGVFSDPKTPSTRNGQPGFHWLHSPFPWDLSEGGSSQTTMLFMYLTEFPSHQPIWETLMKATS